MQNNIAPELPRYRSRRQPIERQQLMSLARRWMCHGWQAIPIRQPKINAPQTLLEHPSAILLSINQYKPKGQNTYEI